MKSKRSRKGHRSGRLPEHPKGQAGIDEDNTSKKKIFHLMLRLVFLLGDADPQAERKDNCDKIDMKISGNAEVRILKQCPLYVNWSFYALERCLTEYGFGTSLYR